LLKVPQLYFLYAFMLFFVQWFLLVLFPCRYLFNLLSSSKILDWFARILHLVWVGWAVVDYHILLKLFLLNHHKLVFVVEISILKYLSMSSFSSWCIFIVPCYLHFKIPWPHFLTYVLWLAACCESFPAHWNEKIMVFPRFKIIPFHFRCNKLYFIFLII
jgi:hypothetical protein